jgi:iturin family lipopeptide synthetase C
MADINISKDQKIAAGQFVKEKSYWMEQLSGEFERSSFLYDYTRASEKGDSQKSEKGSEKGDSQETVNLTLTTALYKRMMELCGGSDPRIHMVLIAVLTALLAKYTGKEDITVATSIDKQDVEGSLVNTILPLRVRFSARITFKELLLKVRKIIKEAIENQNYPIETLVPLLDLTASEDQFPLFDVSLVLENIQDRKYLEHINHSIRFSFLRTHDSIRGEIRYRPALYREESIQRIAAYFLNVLEDVIFNVDHPIDQIDLLSEEDKRWMEAYNDTSIDADADKPGGETVIHLFQRHAADTPENIAVEDAETRRTLSYRQLDRLSGDLGAHLVAKGARPGFIAGILAERSIDFVAAVLGVLKAGGAYIPIDPEYPSHRINYILDDSAADILLTTRSLAEEVGKLGGWDDGKKEIIYLDDNMESADLVTQSAARPEDLAYIIYTSGSTGNPKGVMIRHRSLVNYIRWADRRYVRGDAVNFPLYTSISFDLTITSIFTPLTTGNTVVVYGRWDDGNLVERIIDENKVGVMKLTPSHLSLIRDKKVGVDTSVTSVRRFIVGGDKLPAPLARDIHENFGGNIEIYNEYGPTEATVGCMIHRFDPEKDTLPFVPIGVPAANCRIYLLDEKQAPVPPGAAGEMYIAGTGIAMGYLNRPQLTAEKFNPHLWDYQDSQDKNINKTKVFGGPGTLSAPRAAGFLKKGSWPPEAPLYRTGDIARWLPPREGEPANIDFLGRSDHQVKIRGYRIELGEIEHRLDTHPDVKETVVLVKEDQAGDKYMCAYIVPENEDIFPDTPAMAQELKQYLSHTLSDYMIPSFFVRLEALPLTANGKIDRKALPEPETSTAAEYVAPRNEKEKKLVEIWQQLFGRDNIGINDSFFELGGDSIKTIQISARMKKEGYKVEMRDIFRYPRISELAPVLKPMERIADQSVITGEAPLTPIQHWLFSGQIIDPHHFNQAVMLHFEEGLDEAAVRAIMEKLHRHHDALRMTYRNMDGRIVQTNHDLDYPFSLEVFDFRGDRNDAPAAVEALEAAAENIQASIRLEQGPLLKSALFHLDDGDRLLIVIHHLAIDTVSWRILFEDIETLYHQYTGGKELSLPLKTDSFKLWAEKLAQQANSDLFLKEKSYWAQLESTHIPQIKKDFPVEDNYLEDAGLLSFTLEEEETALLLTKVNRAFGTDINDILLTALALGFRDVFGIPKLLVSLEGHGREEILEDVDITRTVGWFTCMYPVLLDLSHEAQMSRRIKEIKETLRQIPHKGIGYGVMKYLTAPEHKKGIDFQARPHVGFNYLGQFDADVEEKSFGIAKESYGRLQSPNALRPYPFEVLGMITGKRLQLSLTYNKKQYKPETVESLLSQYKAKLGEIITFCARKEEIELTPSDLTYSRLSLDILEPLAAAYPLEDVYTLTPMQDGMLFHTLYEDTSAVYCVQSSYRLHGDWNIPILEKSLAELVKRYDTLRTLFIHEGLERPVQVVLREGEIAFSYRDVREIVAESSRKKNAYVEEFKEKGRQRAFDVSRGPLMRLEVLRLDTSEYEFTWSFHHILMDGWCVGILITDFFEIYNSFLRNRPYRLPETVPYRTYIQWLDRQEGEQAKTYWQKYLEDYDEPAGIPRSRVAKTGDHEFLNEHLDFILDGSKTAALNKMAARDLVTLNTVIQTVWGFILGKYTGKGDVVFGSVVSGRPSEIEGVESIVGLFINTVPVRIRLQETETFRQLLHRIQEEIVAGEPYHHYPLARIQSESLLKQDLLDHILVFENFPVSQELREAMDSVEPQEETADMELAGADDFVYTNYDFYVTVVPRDEIIIRLKYNAVVYEKDLVEKVGNHFYKVLEQISTNDDIPVSQLKLLSETKRERTLEQFSDDLENE